MEVQTLLPIQQHRLNMTATVVKEEVPDSPMVSSRIGPLSSSNFTTPTTNKVCSTTTSDLNQNNNSSNFNLSVLLTDRSQAMCRNSPMGNSPTTNGQPKLTPVISPLSPIKNMKVQPPPKSNPPMTNLPAPPGSHIPPGLEFSTSPNSTTTNSVRVRTPVHSQPVVTSSVMGNAISHSDVAKKNHGNSKTTANDPLSHRIIEKRRRDRMNNCLADLSRLIPTYYLKKGRGRIEKTEIIEMAIKYIKHLQAHACSNIESCDVTAKQERAGKELEQFNLGYQECISEVMHFLVESEGLYSGDSLCVRLVNHLTKHCEKILASEGYISRQNGSSSASSSSGYHANGSSTGSSSDGNGNGSNHASDTKEALLTEESAYRSDERQGSDEAEDMPPNFTGSNLSNMEGGHGTAGAPLQLRDMLQNASAEGPRPYSNYVSCNGPSSNNSSSGDDNAGRLYKFKSNMKHRFSVDLEHSHKNKKQRRDSESSCGNYTDYEKDCQGNHVNQRSGTRPSNYPNNQHNLSKMEDEWDSSPHPEKTETMTPPPLGPNCNSLPAQTRNILDPTKHVPIFALNQNGTYVPLVIDHSIVAPVMDNLQDITTVPHPISIYVNFCSPYHVPLTGPPVAPMGHSLKTPTSTLAQPHYPPSHMPFPNPQTIPHLDNYAPRGHYPDDRRRGGGQYHDRHSRLVSNSQPQSTVATIADSSEKKEPMSSDYRDIPMSNVQMRSDQPPVLHEFMNQMRHPDIRQHDLHRDSREVCDSRESFRHQRTIRDGREPRELAMREGFEPSFMAGNYPRAHIPWAYHASNTKPYKE